MRRWLLTLAALGVVSLLGLSSAEAQIQPRGSAPFEPCSMVSSHNHGCVVTRMKGPGFPGELARGSKVGKACAWNLLYLFAAGDVRIATAMSDGGISKVSSVDYEVFELLPVTSAYVAPLFARYCTVVTGE